MKTRVSSALTLALLLLQASAPAAALAASCSVSALDTVAGLGTQVSFMGCGSGSTSLLVHGPSGIDYTQTIALDASGNAITLVPSRYAETAGKYQVIAAGQNAGFTVIADRADDAHSSLKASPSTIQAINGTSTVTAILRDKFDNPVTGRPMALVSNRTTDDVIAKSAQTDENGRFVWSVSGAEGGQMTLVPYDILSSRQLKLKTDIWVSGGSSALQASMLTGTEQGGDVTADITTTIIDSFDISLPQNATSVKANELFSLTIRAIRNGAIERSYIGTLIVKSSDTDADLPKKGEDPNSPTTGRIDVRSVDQGQRNVPLSFLLRAKGPQTIFVYDKNDPDVKGEITINVLRGDNSGSDSIVILDPKDRSSIRGHSVMLQGHAPSLVNLKVKGGATTVDAESDEEGVFRVNIELNPDDKEATLFVTSESGTYESEPIHIIVDNEPPEIGTITFDPAEGKTGEEATITVKTEADLASVTAVLGEKTVTLAGSGTTYTGRMTAPENPGTYDVTVVAMDQVGNSTTMLTKWTVKTKLVPVVQNVTAESQPLQVLIKWQAIEGMPVKEYRIYIARTDEPTNYLYSVSTKQPVTSAVIKDLPLGLSYQFSLTAVNTDGIESAEKSSPAIASPLGLVLKAKPGQDSILLEWNKIQELPMSKYVLEFRAESTAEFQKIDIDGGAVAYVLKDLIKDVSYEMKLTPVTITGEVMTKLTATVHGTPGGTGFVPGTTDPVPPDLLSSSSASLHPGADLTNPPVSIDELPSTAGSGLSTIVLGLLFVTAIVLGFFVRSYMQQRRLAQEFLRLMQERYHS